MNDSAMSKCFIIIFLQKDTGQICAIPDFSLVNCKLLLISASIHSTTDG